MKLVLLMGALCGNFYQNSAIAKDQDGIVMFGGGILGCAKNPVVQTKNNELYVKCSLGNNIIVDFNRQTATNCSGYFEGNWKITEGELIYKIKILIKIILFAIVLHIIRHSVSTDLRRLTYLHILIVQL